jgi:hypothetical protein
MLRIEPRPESLEGRRVSFGSYKVRRLDISAGNRFMRNH